MVPTHGNGFQLLLILLMPIKFLAIQNDNDFLFRCNENISEEKMWATAAEVVINLEEKSRSWTLINSWIHAFSMIENACSNLSVVSTHQNNLFGVLVRDNNIKSYL